MDEIGEIPITKGLITALDGSLFIEVKEEQGGQPQTANPDSSPEGVPRPLHDGRE